MGGTDKLLDTDRKIHASLHTDVLILFPNLCHILYRRRELAQYYTSSPKSEIDKQVLEENFELYNNQIRALLSL